MEPARDTSPRLFDLPAFFGFAFTSVTSQSLERLFLAHLSRGGKKTKKKLKAAKLTLTSFAPSREAAGTDQRGG